MEFVRELKRGMSGEDVVFIKQQLLKLKYLSSAKKKSFGGDTYKAVKVIQKENNLEVTGKIDELTWNKIIELSNSINDNSNIETNKSETSVDKIISSDSLNVQENNTYIEFKRTLKRYKSGDDVLLLKKRLVELGYLYAATKNIYGNDTYKAVKAFQSANDLEADGIVGKLTWAAIFSGVIPDPDPDPDPDPTPVPAVDIPEWYGKEVRIAIGRDLASVSETRKKVCLAALQHAIDPNNPTPTLKGFYIRAGKSYGTDLKPNIMTKEKLDKYFKKSSYSQYFDNGRKEMMIEQCEKDGYNKIGCDCSGFVCGIWRYTKVVSSSFAACANSLYNSKCTKRSGNPIAGDLVHKDGHIGMYVGGGYVVESVGGAYGVQLTKYKDRRVYNYLKKKLEKMSAWTGVGDPKCYD